MIRSTLLASLIKRFAVECTLEVLATLARTDDITDAFIAAITALAYAGQVRGTGVVRPPPECMDAAREEGWIFFPISLRPRDAAA